MVQKFQKAVDSLFEKLGKAGKYQDKDVLIFLLRPDMVVRDEGILRHITSIHAEGRRWRLHIKCRKSDADTES